MQRLGKWGLLVMQLVGLVLSAGLVALTFANTENVEARLQAFAISKVEQAADDAWIKASQKIGSDDTGRAARLQSLAQSFGVEADAINSKRQQIVPALVAMSLSDKCGENCATWAFAGVAANSILIERAANMRIGQGTLQDFIVERYDTTLRGMITDLRRFGLVNVITLSLMIALVLLRNHLNWRFVALSVAITGYVVWASYGYVFGQNWALSILFQNWASPAYQAGMIFVSALFCDWLFLRGRITSFVGNAIATVLPG